MSMSADDVLREFGLDGLPEWVETMSEEGKARATDASGIRRMAASLSDARMALEAPSSSEAGRIAADAAELARVREALDAAQSLASCVDSLFYAAPETHSYHYQRISRALRTFTEALPEPEQTSE